MIERDVEQYLVEQIRKLGGEAYKFTSPARRNVPDRLVLLPEVGGVLLDSLHSRGMPCYRAPLALFVECKAPGKRPTLAQTREHARLRALGFRVEVVDSVDSVDRLVEGLRV